MLTYNFTNIGSDSMYEYLYKCIKNDILQAICRQERNFRLSGVLQKIGYQRDHRRKCL